MSIYEDMQARLSQVPTALGVEWRIRTRISDRNSDEDTFGAWMPLRCLPLDRVRDNVEDVYEEDELNAVNIRVSVEETINIGDQVKDTNDKIYHVSQQISSGTGTKRFVLRLVNIENYGKTRGGGY